MTVLYTGREPFNQAFPKDGLTWEEFRVWNGFTQMTELLSLDQFLNAELEIFKNKSADSFSFNEGGRRTGLYTSLEHIMRTASNRAEYNLLAVVKDPSDECVNLEMEGFEFAGYDLIDKGYGYSALSNLGSILFPIVATDLNQYGLIQQLHEAKCIQDKISTVYAGLEQAQTYIMAIWRHKHIGRPIMTDELIEIAC
jgi:hypothetical protein